MAKNFGWILFLFSFIILILSLAFWPIKSNHVTVKYDCRIAETSSDYPVAVKEECRKRNHK